MTQSVDYDRVAPTYDRRYRGNNYDGVERHLLAFIAEGSVGRVLEVGCGTGHWLELLSRRGLAVSGLDASLGMLRRAQRHARLAGLVRGTAEELPWRDASFSHVVAINAFHHFQGKELFIAEARRVLRPGGGLISVGIDPHQGLDRWFIYDYFENALETDRRRYPPTRWIRDALRTAGFARCESQVAQHILREVPARAAFEQGRLDRATTSQLALLSDEVYEQGLERIRRALDAAEERGTQLELAADLRLYATTAWAAA